MSTFTINATIKVEGACSKKNAINAVQMMLDEYCDMKNPEDPEVSHIQINNVTKDIVASQY